MAHLQDYRPGTDIGTLGSASGRVARKAAWLLFVLVLSAGLLYPAQAMRRETLKLLTASGTQVIDTEIADTLEEKAQGLMFRTHLDDKSGMLFFYDRPQEITMWMRNTYIPLDMVFIRRDGVVHRIEAMTQPLSDDIVASRGQASACLELAGGAAERLGLKPGDRVEHRFFQGKHPTSGR
jgi:uncharacterized protein